MRNDILELEKILEQEINACSKLEQYITDKRDFLVKGDMQGIITADMEMEKYNAAIEKLEEKRKQIYPDNFTLSEIIERVEEKNKAAHITSLKDKLNELLGSIQKKNKINAELIKHSLKIIENSINSISSVLIPESVSYNYKGKVARDENSQVISSIIHEA